LQHNTCALQELARLTNLHRLFLNNNHLDGEIPTSLLSPEMARLSKVNLASNMLEGDVPLSLCKSVAHPAAWPRATQRVWQCPVSRKLLRGGLPLIWLHGAVLAP
jgi:hypothetical protein